MDSQPDIDEPELGSRPSLIGLVYASEVVKKLYAEQLSSATHISS